MCDRGRSEWPCGLWRGSTAACFLGLPIRIPQGAGMSVSYDCYVCVCVCVLPGGYLCNRPITRPEESYYRVIEEFHRGGLGPLVGCQAMKKQCKHASLYFCDYVGLLWFKFLI